MSSQSKAELFFARTQELNALYEKVKTCIIYAENFDPKEELYVAPINQLRSSLDHIMKAAAHIDEMEYELNEAREHLDRAGYDAFEILASNLGKDIIEKLKPYPTHVITTVFPKYYESIKPKLIEIRANLAEIRKRKKSVSDDKGIDVPFGAYYQQVQLLIDFNKVIETHIPALDEYYTKWKNEEQIRITAEKKARFKDRVFNFIIIGIVSGLIVAIASFYILKMIDKSKAEPVKPKTELN